jgi:alpha-glucosidase (family GH31 glycosyl hydrolase)
VQGFLDNKLPIETMWLDNDYMYDNQNFLWDKINFKGISSFVDQYLHNLNIKFIPVIDGGDMALRKKFVDSRDTIFDFFNNGLEDIWMRSSKKKSIFDDKRPPFIG